MDLRTKLEIVFLTRQKKNPRYTKSAFARSLGIDHAVLSRFLTGKRKLATKTIERILSRIGQYEWPEGKIPTKSTSQYRLLNKEEYARVNHFLHWAVSSLPALHSFKPSVEWISDHLDIPLDQVKKITSDLFATGWWIKSPSGQWLDRSGSVQSPDVIEHSTASIYRKIKQTQLYERRAFEKANDSFGSFRAFTPIRKKDLHAAVRAIHQFQQEFLDRFSCPEGADELFLLNTSIYPLTIPPRKKSSKPHVT